MNMNNFDCVTVSWSSKGTQIAVGRKDGVIVQFDHVSVLIEKSRFEIYSTTSGLPREKRNSLSYVTWISCEKRSLGNT